ncbi:uncharacterized protein DS421_11g340500 [Arachis hypogaea]|nr:uncharacterized protein DS421_11g340500 [Arachis hypogaea]
MENLRLRRFRVFFKNEICRILGFSRGSRVDADFKGLILVSVTCDWLVGSHSKHLGSANLLHYHDIIGKWSGVDEVE